MQLKQFFILFLLLFHTFTIYGQQGHEGARNGGAGRRGGGQKINNGHFYGKVVDAATGKGIEFAPVQLFQNKWDSVTHSKTPTLMAGQLTEANGDFSLENLPLFGKFKLKIAAIGYEVVEMEVSFNIPAPVPGEPKPEIAPGANEKDLGNIALTLQATQLKEIEINGGEPAYKLEIDKKVFHVDKNVINAGATAEEVMRNVPSLSVDIDGNLSLRNSSPQVFVDGRPTNLSLDQLPADAIESVEVITNPSAKYDASGGGAGIVNIVLKKNRKLGYNGSLRFGVDMRKKLNAGADLNLRQKKINVFLNSNFNQRKSLGVTETYRSNLMGNPPTQINQLGNSVNNGQFRMLKGGIDYFMDNRNTFTFSQTYNKGNFNPWENLDVITDSLFNGYTSQSAYNRLTAMSRENSTNGSALLYKHLFPVKGRELTADLSFQESKNNSLGNFQTQHYLFNQPAGDKLFQRQTISGNTKQITFQTDYSGWISESVKLECGGRAYLQSSQSTNLNALFNKSIQDYETIEGLTANYKFLNQVYAVYTTYSAKLDKWTYQAGLRIESSSYTGKLMNTTSTFHNQYPYSFFPTLFASYAFAEGKELQLSYTRKINRPNFFQLIPYTDFSDSLNLRRGNPDLKPEFTNSIELNYQYSFNAANSILLSSYIKNTTGLITGFQLVEFNEQKNKQVVMNTFANANGSYYYGLEIITKNNVRKWLDITGNINLFNYHVDAQNLQKNLSNQLFTWNSKLNINIKLPFSLSYQVSGEYQSASIIPVGGGRGGGGQGQGMGGNGGQGQGMGGSFSSVQGYVKPRYSIDMAIRWEFLKNKAASLSLSVSDAFKTRQFNSYSASEYFIQESHRYRDQQFFRLTFNYRFGKLDASLFRRKNNKNTEGEEF